MSSPRALSLGRLLVAAATLSAAAASAQQTYLDTSPLNTWNTTDANWGAGTTWVNNGAATFAGTGETVSVGTVSVTGLTFSSAGYTLTGGTITSNGGFTINESATINSGIALGAAQSWSVASGKTLTIGGVVSGANTLNYGGAGSYLLNAANTNSGNLTIDTATVTVGASGSLFGATLNWGFRTVTLQNGGTVVASNYSNGSGSFWGQIGDGSNNIIFGSGGGTFRMTGATMNSGVNKGFSVSAGVVGKFEVLSGVTSTWQGSYSGRDFSVGSGGTLQFAIDGTFSTSRIISGAGGISKSGSGLLTLTNTSNSFTGDVAVNGGTLTLTPGATSGNAGPLGAGGSGQNNVTIASGATLILNTDRGSSYHRGSVTLNGGTLTLNGLDNSLASGRAITFDTAAGTLNGSGQLRRRDSGNSIVVNAGGSGSVISISDLNLYDSAPSINVADGAQDADLTISGGISGSSLNKYGAGKLVLSGSSLTYNAGTFVNAGTVQVGAGGTTGMLPGNVSVASGASVVFNRSNDATYSGAVTGSGSLSKAGNGVLTLTGDSNPLGGTTVSAGTLSIGAGSTAGSLAGNITNNAALRFNRSDALTYGAAVSGTGSLTKQGNGTLTLSGANTYSGATTVSAGTLALTGSLSSSSALTVASGATLSGTGTATGALSLSGTANGTLTLGSVTVANGGVLTPGSAGVGSLTMSSLTFGATAGDVATVNLGIASGAVTSGLRVTGALSTLGGDSSVTFAFGSALSTLSQGSYQLIDLTGGSFNGSLSSFGWSGTKGGRQDLAFSSLGGVIYLDVTNSSPIWNGTSTQWSATGAWDPEGGGDALTFEPADTVRFEGAGSGVVELTADVAPASVTVNSETTDYTFSSANGSGITGTGILVKSGGSTLTLASANSFSGGVTLSAGGLRVGDDAALGSGTLALNGGVFAASDASARSLSNAVTLGGDMTLGAAGSGALTVSGNVDLTGSVRVLAVDSDVTLSGVVSNGGLTKSGNATLTLSGVNTFAGALTVAAGTLDISGSGQLGSGTYTQGIANAGVLRFSSSSNQTLSGVLSGVGSLAKSGAGVLTLSAANTFSGKTTVTGGAISVAADSGLGAAPGSAVADQLTLDGGELRVTGSGQTLSANRGITLGSSGGVIRNSSGSNSALVVAGNISGNGGLTLWSTGDTSASGGGDGGQGLRLTGSNTFVGDVTIRSGLVTLGSSFGDAANRIVLNGGGLLDNSTGATLARTLEVQGSSLFRTYGSTNTTVSGRLTGSGTLRRTDGGTMTFTGDLSGFTGTIAHDVSMTTTLSGSAAGFGAGAVFSIPTGTLEFASGRMGSGTVSVSGGTLRWATGNTDAVAVRVAGGTSTLNTNGNNAGVSALSSTSSSANLTKSGTGRLSLAGGTAAFTTLNVTDGEVRLDGASVTLGGKLSVQNAAYTHASGTLSAASIVTSDNSGAGSSLSVSGGLLEVTGTNNADSTSASFIIGHYPAPTTLAISGGEVRSLGANMVLGWDGNATVNQSGGTANLLGIRLGSARTNAATYNLTGGRLNLGANGIVSPTANKTINLGAGTVGALANWTAAQNLSLAASSGAGTTFDTSDASTAEARTITLSGVLSGSGKLTKAGNGTLVLSGANTYSGGTSVTGGTLQLGNAGATGAIAGDVDLSAGGTLAISRSDALTLANNLSGAGALTKSGANALTLSGSLSHTGLTTVSNGSLLLTGSVAIGDVAVGANAVLASSGTVGALTLGSNATLTVGNGSTGSLSAGDVTFLDAATLNIGNFAGYKDSAALSAGALTLGGAVTVNLGGLTAIQGTYRLISFTGAAPDIASFSLGGTAPQLSSRTPTADLAIVGNELVYLVTGSTLYWTGAETSAWSTSAVAGAKNWALDEGDDAVADIGDDYLAGDSVLFDDRAVGTSVSLDDEDVAPLAVLFTGSKDFSIQGSKGIVGGGSVAMQGSGVLTIGSLNSFSGSATLSSGKVRVGATDALGTGALTLSGGILSSDSSSARTLGNSAVTFSADTTLGDATDTGALTLAGAVDLGGATRTLTVLSDVTLSGSVDNGGLAKAGAGRLVLAGDATYAGATTVSGGVLELRGAFSGDVTNNATLAFARSAASTYSGVVSGTGALAVSGDGALTLTGANTYTGATTVASGASLTIGDGAGSGSVATSGFANDGALVFSAGSAATATVGAITGSGSTTASGRRIHLTADIAQAGAVTLTQLGAGGSYRDAIELKKAGTTTITAGSISISGDVGKDLSDGNTLVLDTSASNGTIDLDISLGRSGVMYIPAGFQANAGSGAINVLGTGMADTGWRSTPVTLSGGVITIGVNVTSNASLTLSNSSASTVSGSLSGTMALTKQGSGTLTLSAANSNSGALTVSGGTLEITAATSGNASALGSGANAITVASGARLHFTGANSRTAGYHTGAVTVNGGRITFDTADNSFAAGNTLTFASSAGTLDGTGQWRMRDGANKVVVDAAASGSVISVADLRLTTNGGNHTFEVADGASAADLTISGGLNSHFGNERMTKTGAGNLLLSGAATVAGGLTVSAGTFTLGDGGSLSGSITNNAALAFDRTVDLTHAGLIGGSGTLAKSGAGSVTLTAANTYSGGTTVSAGTLVLGDLAALGTGGVTVAGGFLDLAGLNPTNAITLAGGDLLNAGSWAPASVTVAGAVAAETLNGLTTSSVNLGDGAVVDLSAVTKDLVLTGSATLSNLGSYAGTLAVAAGTLDLSDAGNRPAGGLELRAGGTLDFGATEFTGNVTYKGGAVAGAFSGNLNVSGSGVALSDANLPSGNVVVGNDASVDVSAFTGALALTGTGAIAAGLETFSGTLILADGGSVNLTAGDGNPGGSAAASVLVDQGGVLAGTGSVGSLVVADGGLLAPGNSPGIITAGDTVLLPGGGLELEVLTTGSGIYLPTAGVDYDSVAVGGFLDLSALSSANRFIVSLISLSDATTEGDVGDFDPAAFLTLDVFAVTGAITPGGGSLNEIFLLDLSRFTYGGGITPSSANFSFVDNGAGVIQLQYSPIPEPSTYGLMLGGLALAGAAMRRRRRKD